jgi:uncharacterized protein YndB with AHSA1/START domain
MSSTVNSGVRADVDPASGQVVVSVDLPAAPERAFRAISSKDITRWWVRPGVFDTREWSGDFRVGGRWQTSGMMRGQPYTLGGAFVEIDAPRKLVHTWEGAASAASPSTVSYVLEPVEDGTRLTLRHSGLASPDVSSRFAAGWETSLERLVEILAAESLKVESSKNA